MKLLEKILKAKSRDFLVIKAYADGPNRLFVALEAFDHNKDVGATCVIAVDLGTLAFELVHEAAGPSNDYLYAKGWHGIVQPTTLIELQNGKTTVTVAELGGPNGRLTAVARAGDTTLVAGTKRVGNYDVDGFVARVTDGKLAYLVESSKHPGHPGPLLALTVGASGKILAAGEAKTLEPLHSHLFCGDAKKLAPVPLHGNHPVYALHEKPTGEVMVGCRDSAELYRPGGAETLAGATRHMQGVTEFRDTEYWMGHDGDTRMMLFRRTGTKLAKKYAAKHHYIGYRTLRGTLDSAMTSTDDLLVVTNSDRIHLFDGKKWTQLGLEPNVKKLVKRLPTAMK